MKQQKQSGFAHLMVVTVILAAALAGTLGYVFYRNFIQKDAIISTNNNSDDTKKGYLVLDDWGVKFKLPTDLGSNKITYQKSKDNYPGEGYAFSTERMSALGVYCANVVNLSRQTTPSDAEASVPSFAGKLGENYYYVSMPQSTCSENGLDIQNQDVSMLRRLLLSIEKE